jgi:hypothetical protein
MFPDFILQIFLSLYHGSMVGVFFYDYIIRNLVRIFLNYQHTMSYIGYVALGVIAIAFIVWAILNVWSKIKRNLLITLFVLIVLFVIRFILGILDINERKNDTEYLVVLISQLCVHVIGVIATCMLANNSG